ncbi:protein FAM210B, mitochondrial isoform X2 [Leucoraja erinacea]|uniref:protein FAM210B, mitochondrial isoform X2 n=1 Tax=Leucoraja erinaceus TaxID=7782 RepID=UPI0024552187|nr:protein FAM210B, mitochondrial isoform X2 [Leucoraja erinacea]
MLPHFLLQTRQSLMLHKCLGRGVRVPWIDAAVRTGACPTSRRAHIQPPGAATLPARIGARRGLYTTASKNGPTENEARRSEDGEDKKLNKSQQLKRVFKEYGAVGVVFHIGISLTSLGIFYLAVSRKACGLHHKICETLHILLVWKKPDFNHDGRIYIALGNSGDNCTRN